MQKQAVSVPRACPNGLMQRWRRAFGTDVAGRLLLPRKAQVHLPVHGIAVSPLCIAKAVGITDVQGHVRLGTQLLHHGIESIRRPVEQVTETVDSDLGLSMSQAGVRRMAVPPEHVRMRQSPLCFLSLELLCKGLAHGRVPARCG
jgi:hypothetical protein